MIAHYMNSTKKNVSDNDDESNESDANTNTYLTSDSERAIEYHENVITMNIAHQIAMNLIFIQ